MGSDTETIKERLDIAEVLSGYVKLEKAGTSFKARCPFHNEKTPSFYVSPSRQSYYCFGCGAKGDIFTFVEEMEGLTFREALKSLAERAGVEIEYKKVSPGEKTEKDRIREILDIAREFFEKELKESDVARKYLHSRGISDESVKTWKLGYAPAEWRALYNFLLQNGFAKELIIKAGLAKAVVDGGGKEPYDVFRDRLIFPLSDTNGQVVAFSGRALTKEAIPKYLNTPETVLFTKSELLYGLDMAKEKIRRKNYAVLVEGQIDLVLSHQAGVDNTVASSGTAFTQAHLEKLKRFSQRIILAFDGDKAGDVAAEKAAILAMTLGLEVKVAKLPEGSDPAEVVKDDAQEWKEILKKALPAIEHFLNVTVEEEGDRRKLGKLIERKILPMLTLLDSSMERSHFISLIAKRTGIKEEVIWDDLRRTKKPEIARKSTEVFSGENLPDSRTVALRDPFSSQSPASRTHLIEERLTEVRLWLKELKGNSTEGEKLAKEEVELVDNLAQEKLKEELSQLTVDLSRAETSKDDERVKELTMSIQKMHKDLQSIEEKRKVL